MDQNFTSTKLPTVGASSAIGGAAAWANPSRITANDGSSATWAAFGGGQQSAITGSVFNFPTLPEGAVIDGIGVTIEGSIFSAFGNITLNLPGSTGVPIGVLNGNYGGSDDKWGLDEIDPADIAGLTVTAGVGDVSGGDATGAMDYMSVTLYWHIELTGAPADVPTRVDYKMYSSDGNYLGLIPNVTSKFGFSQDMNSAGSSIQIVSGTYPENLTTFEPILDNNGDPILTNNDLEILASTTEITIAEGDSPEDVMFKNGNRVQVWLYNYWHPNGKLMFSGQVNRLAFQFGGSAAIAMTVYSDGLDLDNFIARGYPFNYTNDVVQTTWNAKQTLIRDIYGAWTFWGQTFRTGAAVTNIGSILLMMDGVADITVSLLDAPNGNVLGSVSKRISAPIESIIEFNFAQLIPVSPSTDYFIRVTAPNNNSIWIYYNTTSVYANGEMYKSEFNGVSAGGTYGAVAGDLYFTTKSGLPTTTTTYSTDDPVTDMGHGILLDYNDRGGIIKERNFIATGLSLTYTFVVATILGAFKKIIELAPTGTYMYVDLGTAEMDVLPTSPTADYTIVFGRDIHQLDLALTIEQVKNYLLLSGGDTGGGVNLFRDYKDTESSARYGIRLSTKSDNRITLDATADAVGDTFIEENAGETQETTVTVLNEQMDITRLTPGKTIGFRNSNSFIDDMIIQISRRDYTPHSVKLTLGRLPITMPAEIQRISRELTMEQTVNNPNAPT